MELAFATKPLRELCESEAKAKQKLGAKIATVLKHRLADLRAANSVKDLPIGKVLNASGAYVLEFGDGIHVAFCPNHSNNPVLKSGAIDWSKVNRIKITGIETTT